MLSLAKVGTGREAYYLSTVQSQAPAGGLVEADGFWAGEGAAILGLEGVVAGRDLRAVFRGADPHTGEILSATHDRVRVRAYDLTFSTPKSLSVLMALGPLEAAGSVMAAHAAAVAAAVGYLERETLQVRRAADGRRSVPAEGMTAAAFVHRSSRAPDPHLHTHLLVANLACDGAGRWSPLDARPIYGHRSTAGHLYEAHLRAEITRLLGLRWRALVRGWSDLIGVEPSVLQAFSSRSRQIREIAAEMRLTTPAGRALVAERTRPDKDLSTSYEKLRDGWADYALTIGVPRGTFERLVDEGRRRLVAEEPSARAAVTAEQEARWVQWALGPEGLTRRSPSFTRQEVIRARCRSAREGATATDLETLADRLIGSRLVVERPAAGATLRGPAGGRIPTGQKERRFTTVELLAVEREVLSRVDAGWAVTPATPAGSGGASPGPAPNLSEVERLLLGRLRAGRPVEVVDVAGTARDDLLEAAARQWQADGREPLLVMPTARTASRQGLASGMRCVPLDKAVTGGCRLPEGAVVAVVGAQSADPRSMLQLLERTAAAGGRLVLITDLPRSAPDLIAAQIGERVGLSRVEQRSGEQGLALASGALAVDDERQAALRLAQGEAAVVLTPTIAGARAQMLGDAVELCKSGQQPLLVVADPKVAAELRAVLDQDQLTAGLAVVAPRQVGRQLARELVGAQRPEVLVLGAADELSRSAERSTAASRRHYAAAPELAESSSLGMSTVQRVAQLARRQVGERSLEAGRELGR